jgi:cell division protein FtsI (penicillin-binding protein 3)
MLLAAMLLAFAGVSARLTHLQLLAPEAHAERGVAQRLRTVDLEAQRGSLFDRNGNELAMSVPQQTVWADPRLVLDPAAAAAELAAVLDVEEAVVRERLSDGDSRFVYLARQIDGERAAAVEALDLDGINLREEPRRFRPAGELAAGVLGEVDLDGGGVSGLERQYEERLAGQPGELLVERGADGGTIAGGERRLRAPVRGEDLVLTIDRSLQYEVERSLSQQVVATGADGGMAVVMDPRSGDILAMASIEAGRDRTPRPTADNATLSDVFEPGSVAKVVTLGAAIEEGVADPDDVMAVPDSLRIGPKTFTDSSPHPTWAMTVAEVLGQSSNVGTIMLAREIGGERLGEYLERFGFGEPAGLDFPGATAGLVPPVEDWASTSIGSIAIGQGIGVNAVQMLGAVNVVANDGVRAEPRLVRSVVDPEGEEHPVPAAEGARVVSEETAAQMTTMLEAAVSEGTGLNARVEGYTVAGKTGTARKPSTEFRGYEPGAYTSVFAGFVPAEEPRLSIIVILDEARPYYGGVVAAPVFAEIAEYGLRLLSVPPTVAPPTEPVEATPTADDVMTQD